MLEEKRKKYRNNLIIYLLVFIPCVLALIVFNVLLICPTTNSCLALIVAVLGQFAFPINAALIVFCSLMGLSVAFTTRGYITTKKKIQRFENGKPKQSLKDDSTVKNEIYEGLARSEEKRKKFVKFVILVFILIGVLLYSFIAYYIYSFNPDIPYNTVLFIVIAPLVVASIAYGIYERKKRKK